MNHPVHPMVSARIAAIILKGAEVFGASVHDLVRATGFDLALIDDVDVRIPLDMENALWDMAAELSNDDCFGLHVAELIRPGMFDVLDYVVRTAPTLLVAVQRLARYNRLMHDVAEFSLTERPDGVQIEHFFRTPMQTPSRHAADFTMAALLTIAEQMSGKPPEVLAAGFIHAAPGDTAEFRRIFGVTPAFGMSTNSLLFRTESLSVTVPDADPALSRIVTSHADRLLAGMASSGLDSLTKRVSHLILEHLSNGKVSLALVASKLCLSERSLQRGLSQEGTSFNALYESLRLKAARDFIADQRLALGEVAYLLGFSEPSAFHRAFKRWTGQTPMAARQSLHAQDRGK